MGSKLNDLTGKRFGKLVVVQRAENKVYGRRQCVAWNCECDCGKHKVVSSVQLMQGHAKSCGCLRREASKRLISPNEKNTTKFYEGTSISTIASRSPRSNSRSRVRGVSWSDNRKLWVASIGLQGKVHFLGRYAKLEDAIKARKLAEEKYFEPILEKYSAQANT